MSIFQDIIDSQQKMGNLGGPGRTGSSSDPSTDDFLGSGDNFKVFFILFLICLLLLLIFIFIFESEKGVGPEKIPFVVQVRPSADDFLGSGGGHDWVGWFVLLWLGWERETYPILFCFLFLF
jgi:hypothetical protein